MAIKLYNPEYLDIDAIIKANPIPKGKGIHRDNLLFIIHCIMIRMAYLSNDQLKKIGKQDGFLPLNAKYLEKKISRYKNNIEYLKKVGVIETDDSYLTRNVSKGYRLTSPYTGQGFKKTAITYLPLCNKIKKDSPFRKDKLAAKEFPYLAKWFQSGKLEIDFKEASNWINESEKDELLIIDNNSNFSNSKKLSEKKKTLEKHRGFRILATRLEEKNYYFNKDEFGNRLHTNLTNLPKELRNFLSYDGQNLVSIDIRNSQPYMSLPVMTKKFWQSKPIPGKPTLLRIDRDMYKNRRWDKYKRNNIIMFNDSPEMLASSDFQLSEFVKNVTNGSFYEHLISVFDKSQSIDLGTSEQEKRVNVKRMVLTVLFDFDNKFYNKAENSAYQAFKKEFPTVSKVFRHIKEGGYRSLAKILQKIESFLILSVICKRISKETPHIPIFTIHDSIVTTKGNEEYVQSVMKEELEKGIGIAPKFSIEYWIRQDLESVEAA